MEFKYEGNTYKYTPYSMLLNLENLPTRKDYKQSKFLDIGCGFDIETSKIPNENLSFMYMWQFSIDNGKHEETIIGRTWEEFAEFLDRISAHYQTDKKPLLVWVMNFSYEWQFIKKRLQWKIDERGRQHIFAIDKRKIVKAETTNGIEFRDAYILTQMGLKQLAKSYNLPIQKLNGDDFDYNEVRFSDTPLKDNQIAYGINDVRILSTWYHTYIKREFIKKHVDIPLTATGIVRGELKRAYKKWDKRERLKYKRLVNRAYPNQNIYDAMISWLYRGGYTHANVGLVDNTWINLDLCGYDIKSSYPSSLLHEVYPYEFVERTPDWFNKYGMDKAITKRVAYFGTFVFHNIRSKTTLSLESKNKIIEYSEDAIFDNGRLLQASHIVVILNEVDLLECYKSIYDWDSLECLSIYKSDKKPLPKFLLDIVLKYYYLKESIQETDADKKLERFLVKKKLNSCYGMLCTSLYHTNIEYDIKQGVFVDVENKKTYEQLAKEQILLPQHGIWCTSYSRARLIRALVKCDEHHICYSDTDSLKILNKDGCEWVFQAHNDTMERINNTMYVGEYDRAFFRDCGKFTFEDKYIKFKCLGSKRYIYSTSKYDKKDGKYRLHNDVTIAGMTKGSLQKYCENEGLDIYEEFRHNLVLLPEDADKLTSSYTDVSWDRIVDGHHIREESCVCLLEIPFTMSLTMDYIALIKEMHNHNMRVYGNRF